MKKIFVCYSHKDDQALIWLENHLKPLKRYRELDYWSDKRIQPGEDWEKVINESLATSDFAILILSPNALASDFIVECEFPTLLAKGITILPLLLRPCSWDSIEGLNKLQLFNDPNRPLASMRVPQRDEVGVRLFNFLSQKVATIPPVAVNENLHREEMLKSLSEFRQTGKPRKVPISTLDELGIPPEVKIKLLSSLQPGETEIEVMGAAFAKIYHFSLLTDSPETSMKSIRFKLVNQDEKEMRFKSLDKVPYSLELNVSLKSNIGGFSCEINIVGSTVLDALPIYTLINSCPEEGIKVIWEDLNFEVSRLLPEEFSDDFSSMIDFLNKILTIQRKTYRIFLIPRIDEVQDSEKSIDEVYEIVTKGYREVEMKFKGKAPRDMIERILEVTKEEIPNNIEIAWEEAIYSIFGNEIWLGPVVIQFPDLIIDGNLRKDMINFLSGSEEKFELQFEQKHARLKYVNWFKEDLLPT
jgi:hypothetical protein